jgi:hypothetical protein
MVTAAKTVSLPRRPSSSPFYMVFLGRIRCMPLRNNGVGLQGHAWKRCSGQAMTGLAAIAFARLDDIEI